MLAKEWLALLLLLITNPLSVYFMHGVAEYAEGAPSLRFYGLPSIASYNIDRQSRAFRSGGGCIVYGNEWVFLSPHNAAVRLMAKCFGPPYKSYDGPYPTQEVARHLTANAPTTSTAEFQSGQVKTNRGDLELGAVTTQLVEGLRLLTFTQSDAHESDASVQACVVKNRCLLLRLSEYDSHLASGSHKKYTDLIVLLDIKNKRPFAVYDLIGDHFPIFPLPYLPEHQS